VGSRAHWAPAWVGRLLANFIAYSALLRLLAAAAQPKAAASKSILFIRTIGRFCRYNTLKNYTDAASKASREPCLRSTGKRANFSAAKNLPFCSKKSTKFTGFSKRKMF
jgi:hypothetical protein